MHSSSTTTGPGIAGGLSGDSEPAADKVAPRVDNSAGMPSLEDQMALNSSITSRVPQRWVLGTVEDLHGIVLGMSTLRLLT